MEAKSRPTRTPIETISAGWMSSTRLQTILSTSRVETRDTGEHVIEPARGLAYRDHLSDQRRKVDLALLENLGQQFAPADALGRLVEQVLIDVVADRMAGDLDRLRDRYAALQEHAQCLRESRHIELPEEVADDGHLHAELVEHRLTFFGFEIIEHKEEEDRNRHDERPPPVQKKIAA